MSSKTIPQPWQLGVNHSDWRPHQYEAVRNVFDALQQKPISILEAPTGTGKTAIATAVAGLEGGFGKTTVVVQNLGLLEQYKTYGFNILKGKQAYPCVLDKRVKEWKTKFGIEPTASDCPYAEMYQCPAGTSCPYMIAREKAIKSSRMACTYKYAALSKKVQDRTGLFVMDEIHNAVSEILSIGSFQMDEDTRIKMKLPVFPLMNYGDGDGDLLQEDDIEDVTTWIFSSMKKMGNINLFDEITPEGTKKKKMYESFQSLLELLSVCRGEVFYRCSKDDVWRSGTSKKMWRMTFRTISPSYLYHKMVSKKDKILMMSATVGSPSALIAGELRIKKGSYDYVRFPHPVPCSKRPIYDIAEAPMSHANLSTKPWLYDLQAKRIAQFIKTKTHPDWRGIVLTTSYFKIKKLREALGKYLGSKRIFENESVGLQERITEFMEDDTPSMIHVDTIQGWGTGVDLRGDMARYCVVAGVPFYNPMNAFERIRMNTRTGRAYATAYAYNAVMQAAGRVSRGTKVNGEYLANIGALADKLATSPYALKHYSDWFKEAMIKN